MVFLKNLYCRPGNIPDNVHNTLRVENLSKKKLFLKGIICSVLIFKWKLIKPKQMKSKTKLPKGELTKNKDACYF